MKSNFFLRFLMLAVVQLLICNYFNATVYISLSILPTMILCLPTRFKTINAMLIAAGTALFVDFFAEGLAGLNFFALVPVALCRRTICDFFFGHELVARGDDLAIRKYGWGKALSAVLTAQIIFLLFYLWADGGAVRPFGFNLLRFTASLGCGVIAAIPVLSALTPDDRR